MKGTNTGGATMADLIHANKELADLNMDLAARLAEKDETIDRMQGLLETCDASMESLRARLAEAERLLREAKQGTRRLIEPGPNSFWWELEACIDAFLHPAEQESDDANP